MCRKWLNQVSKHWSRYVVQKDTQYLVSHYNKYVFGTHVLTFQPEFGFTSEGSGFRPVLLLTFIMRNNIYISSLNEEVAFGRANSNTGKQKVDRYSISLFIFEENKKLGMYQFKNLG